jgi:hypothetical protein
MLINKKHVKMFALEMAKGRAHKFTRVGGDFLLKCEGQLKEFIRGYVRRLPSKGKTEWFVGPSRNQMVIPTTPIYRKTKTGANMLIGSFDNRNDAILAAAAPDLLAALKMFVAQYEGDISRESRPEMAAARHAITKTIL